LAATPRFLAEVVIDAGAIVGAGSVVTRSVQDGAVVAGNSARELARKTTA
jgi:acetyltransferase-like isoleucine patch superfamily enzyme